MCIFVERVPVSICPALRGAVQVVELSVLITFVLNVCILLPCALLLCFHLFLVAHGRTAYEWRQVRAGVRSGSESLFDYGMVNNFALTLGVYPLLWLLPVRTGIEGNGIFFPERGLGADRALGLWRGGGCCGGGRATPDAPCRRKQRTADRRPRRRRLAP